MVTKSIDTGVSMTPEQSVAFICRNFRSNKWWAPSQALSRCLAVSYERLLIVKTPKDDLANLVWTSVLVLVYCATRLVKYREIWYEVANMSTAWLCQQQHFVDQRKDLEMSACNLLNLRDPDQLLSSLFDTESDTADPVVGREAVLQREGWQVCYLDEPPYTAYYWNATKNHSTWRHPLETALIEREAQERKKKHQNLLIKVLSMRLPINRDIEPPIEVQRCFVCAVSDLNQTASVLCLDCGSKYLCDACCDSIHCDRVKRSHLRNGLRFRECWGRAGFPKSECKELKKFSRK